MRVGGYEKDFRSVDAGDLRTRLQKTVRSVDARDRLADSGLLLKESPQNVLFPRQDADLVFRIVFVIAERSFCVECVVEACDDFTKQKGFLTSHCSQKLSLTWCLR